jgi:hypothetical protein
LHKRSAYLEENPNNIINGLPADIIIINTKIIASQRLSKKRSKPPKAPSMQDKTEDKRTWSIYCRNPPTGCVAHCSRC